MPPTCAAFATAPRPSPSSSVGDRMEFHRDLLRRVRALLRDPLRAEWRAGCAGGCSCAPDRARAAAEHGTPRRRSRSPPGIRAAPAATGSASPGSITPPGSSSDAAPRPGPPLPHQHSRSSASARRTCTQSGKSSMYQGSSARAGAVLPGLGAEVYPAVADQAARVAGAPPGPHRPPPAPWPVRHSAACRCICCAYSSSGAQVQTRLRSPWTLSTRFTGGQYLCARDEGQREGGFLARVGVRPLVRHDLGRGVRRVLQRVVGAVRAALLHRADLGADGDHRLARSGPAPPSARFRWAPPSACRRPARTWSARGSRNPAGAWRCPPPVTPPPCWKPRQSRMHSCATMPRAPR